MIKDKIGQEIKPGVFVAYGVQRGSHSDIELGMVIKAASQEKKRQARKWFPNTPTLVDEEITYIDTKVSVYRYRGNGEAITDRLHTLKNPSRMIVIEPSALPAEVIQAYAEVKI